MSNTARLVLTFLSVAVAAVLGADPAGWLPVWASVLLAALSAGFAAIGIPASVVLGNARTRSAPTRGP